MQPQFNTEHSDLTGTAALSFANGLTLDDFCAQHIVTYNKDRFQAIAIRLFEGNETAVTVYALDKMRQQDDAYDPGKIPVKKFRMEKMTLTELFSYIASFNCTLTTGQYPIEEMEVENK